MKAKSLVALAVSLACTVAMAQQGKTTGAKNKSSTDTSQSKPDFGKVQIKNMILGMHLNACTSSGNVDFINMQMGKLPDGETQKCVDDGKSSVKEAFDDVKKGFGKNKPPEELVNWRIEWAAAFSAAVPQMGDTERSYLQKIGEAKMRVDRATAKLEIAME